LINSLNHNSDGTNKPRKTDIDSNDGDGSTRKEGNNNQERNSSTQEGSDEVNLSILLTSSKSKRKATFGIQTGGGEQVQNDICDKENVNVNCLLEEPPLKSGKVSTMMSFKSRNKHSKQMSSFIGPSTRQESNKELSIALGINTSKAKGRREPFKDVEINKNRTNHRKNQFKKFGTMLTRVRQHLPNQKRKR